MSNLPFQSKPCHDCPFRKEAHISISNIEELLVFLEEERGHVGICHNNTSLACEGAEIYKEHATSTGIMTDREEILIAHNRNKRDVRSAILSYS